MSFMGMDIYPCTNKDIKTSLTVTTLLIVNITQYAPKEELAEAVINLVSLSSIKELAALIKSINDEGQLTDRTLLTKIIIDSIYDTIGIPDIINIDPNGNTLFSILNKLIVIKSSLISLHQEGKHV